MHILQFKAGTYIPPLPLTSPVSDAVFIPFVDLGNRFVNERESSAEFVPGRSINLFFGNSEHIPSHNNDNIIAGTGEFIPTVDSKSTEEGGAHDADAWWIVSASTFDCVNNVGFVQTPSYFTGPQTTYAEGILGNGDPC